MRRALKLPTAFSTDSDVHLRLRAPQPVIITFSVGKWFAIAFICSLVIWLLGVMVINDFGGGFNGDVRINGHVYSQHFIDFYRDISHALLGEELGNELAAKGVGVHGLGGSGGVVLPDFGDQLGPVIAVDAHETGKNSSVCISIYVIIYINNYIKYKYT